MDKIKLNLLHSKGKKKDKKTVINSFLISLGDSLKLDYMIGEESKSYNYTLTMGSGDAFVVSSDVQEIQVGVQEVIVGTKPDKLVLREGSLLMTFERE